MDKKYLVPVLFVGIGAAFLAVSLLLYFRGGKSARLTARKMRLGALLLTLGSFASCDGGGGETMCYVTVQLDQIEVKNAFTGELVLDTDSSRTVEGSIYEMRQEHYSYAVYDNAAETMLSEADIIYSYQEGDSTAADFSFELDSSLVPGDYQLRFYNFSAAENDTVPFVQSIVLKLTE